MHFETDSHALPDAARLADWLRRANSAGPRLTGSPAHHAFVDALAQGFQASGLEVERLAYRLTRWEARAARVQARDSASARSPWHEVPVASCYPFCAPAPAAGAEGPLLPLGDIRTAQVDARARGAILLATCTPDSDWCPPVRRLWSVHDPRGEGAPTPPPLATRQWRQMQALRHAASAAGARGLLLGWKGLSEEQAAGQYQPIEHLIRHLGAQGLGATAHGGTAAAESQAFTGVPALWLGPQGQAELHAHGPGAWVRLQLEAALHTETPTDTLAAFLPGRSRQSIVLLTHTDGVNACQENGALALLALARHAARVPQAQRPLGLACIATTGHFAGGLRHATDGRASSGELADALAAFPDLARDAVAVIGVEQLGARAWHDAGPDYVPAPTLAWSHAVTAHPVLARLLMEGFASARHCALSVADTGMLGEAAHLGERGVPAALYMGIPSYVMASAPDGHLPKLSPQRMQEEIQALAHVVDALGRLPAGAWRT